ncbi:MAG: BREX-1 system adenine-specific DNA-methyltransferase PglX, partial [Ruminococcus sp.]|nr:BREX-1 system adenine-specific DNA-methyltransferase PglX [Ruminococcus sp.]
MNKTAIKNFAVWARVTLINAVTQRAFEYEITENGKNDPAQGSVNGRSLTDTEKNQRSQLIAHINVSGFTQAIEEAAYTWFNRFIALRFMEVNNYLPSHTRIFSDEENNFKPEVLSDAVNLDIDGLDKELVLEMLENQENEQLYKYIIITQCNALNEGLPEMFEEIGGWTELLFPRNLLREDSVVAHMVGDIPEEDWKDQVQIIGWLYQYYNTEPKDKVFADLKKNIKIGAEAIPAATQLFTPDWIVRYMVENSLGRLWTEGHSKPENADWKYYLDEAEQEENVKAELAKIREEYKSIQPEQIRFLDPCMGSGHILVYAFDVLMDIYTACGWSERDAAKSILKNNLYGMDIDRRAYQLAYFSVMMKARYYNRRILSNENQPNLANFADVSKVNTDMLPDSLKGFAEQFRYADTYGSLMEVSGSENIEGIISDYSPTFGMSVSQLEMMMKIYRILSQKYDVVCTNPPYMGGSGMNAKLSDFVKKCFPDSKSDLFACFIDKCGQLAKPHGFYAMITQPSFLFLSSFEKLRSKIVIDNTISSLVHMGRGIFGIDFGSTAFVINKSKISDYFGCYFRLHERTFQYIDPDDIAKLYLMSKGDKTVKYDFSTYDTKNESLEQEKLSGKSLQLYYEA